MATGVVEVSLIRGKSTLTRLYSSYPIRLMQQLTWSNYVHLQLLGFGGGLVSGDAYSLHIMLQEGTQLSLRTPGSAKLYKALAENLTLSRISARLQHGSLLTILPDANACCPGARFKQHVYISMEGSTSMVFVDWYSSGNLDGGKAWQVHLLQNEVVVEVDGQPLFIENQRLSSTAHGSVCDKVGGAGVFGFVLLVGPATADIRYRLEVLRQRKTYRQVRDEAQHSAGSARPDTGHVEQASSLTAPTVVSVSNLNDTCKILRFSLRCEEEAYVLLHEVLKPLNAQLPGCNAYADRLSSLEHSATIMYGTSEHVALLRQYDLQTNHSYGSF